MLPEFKDIRHMNLIELPTLRTVYLYPQEIFLVVISVRGQVHSAAGRIMSMINYRYATDYRIRDLQARSAVPQATALPVPLAYNCRSHISPCPLEQGCTNIGIARSSSRRSFVAGAPCLWFLSGKFASRHPSGDKKCEAIPRFLQKFADL